MACSKHFSHAEGLELRTFRQRSRTCYYKRFSRPLSFLVPASTRSSMFCPIYKSVDISVCKLVPNNIKRSSIVSRTSWTTSVLKNQSFSFALSSSLPYFGKGNDQHEARKRLLVSASSSAYSETVEEASGISLSKKDVQIASVAAITVMFAVANKLLYKMALVPLKEYPFFLALINTLGYVLVYFSILYIRYRVGMVTDEMLELPKSHFILMGVLEALGVTSGMAAAAILPGASIPILLQTFLVWQLVLSMTFLKKRYSVGQIMGCIMVLAGVVIALASSASGLALGDQIGYFWPSLMILSSAFQASATIVKEFVFRNASARLKGGSVDIFVVNSFGSGFQALFVLLILPLLSQLRGIPFSQLPRYMKDGAGCLFNMGSSSTDCSGATLLTFAYVVVNLGFNISLLSLLKMSSALVSSLCTTLAVPLAIYMFTLPLPYVGAPAVLPPQFLIGTVVLLSGLAFYNFSCNCGKFIKHD